MTESRPASDTRFEQRLIMATIVTVAAVIILALIATVVLLLQHRDAAAVTPIVTGGLGMLSPSPLSKSATRPRNPGGGP